MGDGRIIFEQEDVIVTAVKVVIDGEVFAVEDIVSVSMKVEKADGAPIWLVSVLGGIVWRAVGGEIGAVIFVASLLFWIVLSILNAPEYILQIADDNFENDFLFSRDKAYVEESVKAIKLALKQYREKPSAS